MRRNLPTSNSWLRAANAWKYLSRCNSRYHPLAKPHTLRAASNNSAPVLSQIDLQMVKFHLEHQVSKARRREFLLMTGLSWLITAITAAVAVFAYYRSDLKFAPTLIPLNLVVAMFGVAVFSFYLLFKNDFFILSLANGVAIISAFSTAGALFSYVAIHYSTAFELRDATFASIDGAFQLSWLSLVNWVSNNQPIAGIMEFAYGSIPIQAIGALAVLSLLGDYRRLQMLILGSQTSALICSVVAAFLPAVGEYTYLKINTRLEFPWLPSVATSYVVDVMQLRTKTLLIQLDSFKGVITFPSFHAALGLLFIWAMWKVPVVRWAALFLNGVMIVATPVFGGHYFVDVAAGLVVAIFSIWIANGTVQLIQATA